MAGPFVRALQAADFEELVLKSDKPVVLDFGGEYCGSCKALLPVLESLARDHQNTLSVFTVDVVASPELAARFNVRSIPTLLFFRDGALKGTHVGTLSAAGMLAKLSA